MSYCTLFGSNYLDKGIAMIDSLKKVDADTDVYILCMDDLTHRILKGYYATGVNLINLEEFEDNELLSVKNSRSFGEYCWTCTAKLILFVLDRYDEICTYVDADLFFYNNPACLIEEMKANNCVVQVIAHRFAPTIRGKQLSKTSGKFCVQFNTFTRDNRSINLLKQWIRQCVDDCSWENGGDQKYIDNWNQYDFVNVSDNAGAGVAPWNINRFCSKNGNYNNIYDRFEKKTYDLIFYHFQNVTNVDKTHVLVLPFLEYGKLDKKLVNALYYDYITLLVTYKKQMNADYNYLPMTERYISDVNDGKSFLQRIFTSFKKRPSEIIRKILYRLRTVTRRNLAFFATEFIEEKKGNDTLQ